LRLVCRARLQFAAQDANARRGLDAKPYAIAVYTHDRHDDRVAEVNPLSFPS
jgi:hypothetical protein